MRLQAPQPVRDHRLHVIYQGTIEITATRALRETSDSLTAAGTGAAWRPRPPRVGSALPQLDLVKKQVSVSPRGEVTGVYVDANNVVHGFVRDSWGRTTTLDAPGAGTGDSQGTYVENGNPAGAIAGSYVDANYVMHGFERSPDGTFITFDAPGHPTGAWQGANVFGLNQQGLIIGSYTDDNNVTHGFLAVPRLGWQW
jgi:hypothetical protein